MTFAKEAWLFVLPLALAAAALALWRKPAAAGLLGALALATLLFFRVPKRGSAAEEGVALAPANGRVTRVETVAEPLLGPGRFHRVVTFLSVFDVHVQRSPVAGEVTATHFRRGRKVAAFRADAGEVNESLTTVIKTDGGETIAVTQIAGLVARRVVGYLQPEQRVEVGQLMGLIKFGSRVDLTVPESYEILVRPGQRVIEGVTPMARRVNP